MGGIEYYGFSEATVALEVVERHLFGHNSAIRAAPNFVRADTLEWTLRYTADWLNARLGSTVLVTAFGYKFQDGVVLRAQGDYDILDGLVFTAGILAFFDLANAGSISHVLSQDIGSVREGRVRLRGRLSGAEPRGVTGESGRR